MKKLFLAVAVALSILGGLSACDRSTSDHTHETQKVYTCPMHPEVRSDEAGKCTKCGMPLKEEAHDDDHESR